VIADKDGIESLACGCGAELRGLKGSH
jgi:hypothetical protein